MDAVIIDEFVHYVDVERNYADYFLVSAIALFLYDYVLTLHQEIKLLWCTPWNHMKFLFFSVRYVPFGIMYIELNGQLFLDVSTESCHKMWPATAFLATLVISFAEAALVVRTWAVWNRNRYIGAGLAILWIATLINGCYFNADFVKSIVISPKPYDGFRGCFFTSSNNSLREAYIFLAVVEAVVMTLMAISAYRSYKYGSMSELSIVVHRDGIVYYILLLVAAIVNVILTYALHVKVEEFMAIPLQINIQSLLTTRILINIRKAAYVKPTYAEPEFSTSAIEMHSRVTVEGVKEPSDDDCRFEKNV